MVIHAHSLGYDSKSVMDLKIAVEDYEKAQRKWQESCRAIQEMPEVHDERSADGEVPEV